jgi:hypothetical protein
MAQLSRYAALHLTLAALLCASAGAARAGFDPVGTWYVLIHYTDDNSAHPETWRWDDRIWVFEPKGSRLRWTEYPIVVFRNRDGRFEALGTNRASRVMHAWEPDESQLEEIRRGLQVNFRGRKSKTLRAAPGEGWRSHSRATAASASVITYTEHWSLVGVEGLPVFERVDQLGSARTESLDGVTRYTTTEIEAGGDLLRGTFERDGTRHGTFRLMRAGAVGDVEGSGKSEGERVYELFFGEFGAALLKGDEGLQQELERRIQAGEKLSEEERAEIHQEIRRSVERSIRRQGLDPARYQREIDSLTAKVERQVLEEGRSLEEVGRMIENGEIKP